MSDRNIARIIAKAATITTSSLAATAFGASFADEVYTANFNIGTTTAHALDGAKIVAAIYAALEEFDKKDIGGDKVCVLPPAQYYALLNVPSVANAAWLNRDVGGEGSVASGVVPQVGGVKIMMSNHLPSTNQSSASGDVEPITSTRTAAYRGNYAALRGLIFSQDAAATVKLLDLGVESEYQIDRQGTLMVAKYAMGHNILRPACAISLNAV